MAVSASGRYGLAVALVTAIALLSLPLLFSSGYVSSSRTARTIKIIVPSSVGGGADLLARLLAEQISRAQNLTMVVENRPGASNTIGTEVVSRAEPDGNTLLINTPEFVINAHLRTLKYDPLTNFKPICYLVRSPQLFVVNSSSPYNTLGDLLSAARAKPAELTIASAGPASSTHIAVETLKRLAGVKMNYIPYQGSAPAVNALLAGQVTSALASYPNVVEQVKGNKLRALATASLTRIEQMPDVPTVAESGFKDYESEIWFGVVAPAETPDTVVSQLATWFMAAIQVPELQPKFAALGFFKVGLCGAEFGSYISKQYEKFGRAIQENLVAR
jgi:tripartite-type tricarboxylate transporter receptor subunit TctC